MQSPTLESVPKILPRRLRLLLCSLMGISALLVLAGAISIPFYFESSTILYKFGMNRLLLRSGQVLGLVAGCLLLLQIILSARLKCLDRLFGLSHLFRLHRRGGLIIAAGVIVHPILVFIPEDRIFIPLQWRYWPEFTGLFLLLLIVTTVIASHGRVRLRFSFHRWWPMHRWAAVLITTVFWVHVLSVSETFEQKIPKLLALCAVGLCGLLFFWTRTRTLRIKRSAFPVTAVAPAGEDAVCLRIISTTKRLPAYLPGQFGFITIFSPHISREEHPFSIASTPGTSTVLEFIVRTTGDWTRHLKDIQPGDSVLINGPYGQFSHLRVSANKEIIMIAGGIGITPMLSMLRYMAGHNDQRKITLIWSNRSRKHIILPDEFRNLAVQLKQLRIVHVMTREPDFKGEKGRLDRSKIQRLLSDCSISSAVFVCGPDQMMQELNHALVSLGFSKRMIFWERFHL